MIRLATEQDQAMADAYGYIIDIGQDQRRKELNARVKRGEMIKVRGYWFPCLIFGIGPLKTVWINAVPTPQYRQIEPGQAHRGDTATARPTDHDVTIQALRNQGYRTE